MKYSHKSLLFSIIFFYISLFIYGAFFYQLHKLYTYFKHNTSPVTLNKKKSSLKDLQATSFQSTHNQYCNSEKNIIDHLKLSEQDIEKIFIFNFSPEKIDITKNNAITISKTKQTQKNIHKKKKSTSKKKLIIQKNKKKINTSKKKNLEKKTSPKSLPGKQLPTPNIPHINLPKNSIPKGNNIFPHNYQYSLRKNMNPIENKIMDTSSSYIEPLESHAILEKNNKNSNENYANTIIIDYVTRILKKIYCYIGKKTNHDIVFVINDHNHISQITYTPKKPSLSFKIHIENILKNENIPPQLINQELALKI